MTVADDAGRYGKTLFKNELLPRVSKKDIDALLQRVELVEQLARLTSIALRDGICLALIRHAPPAELQVERLIEAGLAKELARGHVTVTKAGEGLILAAPDVLHSEKGGSD